MPSSISATFHILKQTAPHTISKILLFSLEISSFRIFLSFLSLPEYIHMLQQLSISMMIFFEVSTRYTDIVIWVFFAISRPCKLPLHVPRMVSISLMPFLIMISLIILWFTIWCDIRIKEKLRDTECSRLFHNWRFSVNLWRWLSFFSKTFFAEQRITHCWPLWRFSIRMPE